MAVYEIEGQQYEIPDEVQGQKLIETLTLLSEQSRGDAEGFFGAEVLEPAITAITGAAGEVAGGVTGLAAGLLTQDAEAAEAVRSGVAERLTVMPSTERGMRGLQAVGEFVQPVAEVVQEAEEALGEAGFQTAGPVGGAIGATIPTAIMELLGFAGGRSLQRLSKVKTRKAQEALKAIDEADRGIITDKGLSDIAETLKKGDADDIAQIIDADPEFYRAADELGITTEPLASFASRNAQFRDIEGGLRKVPGSILEPQALEFIKATSQKADDLIQQYGGTLDKAQLGLDFKESSLKTVADLAAQADDAYAKIAEILPNTARYSANETTDFLMTKADELGGVSELPSKLQGLLKSLQPVDGKGNRINPTLGKIDQVRREIGQATNKGTGPFKDVETGLNKALYARLTKDQDAIAASGGLKDVTDGAKGLIIQRKQLEDNLQTLLGKDLNKALNVTVSGAIKNLSKGQIDQFNKVMTAIPRTKRGEVALSAMNDVFKGSGVGQSQLSPTQFVKWYDTLKRSPSAKASLFKYLPPKSRKAIDNLYEVSRGISRASQQVTPTGRINALFNEESGLIRKMVAPAAARAVAFSTGSPLASVATDATMQFLRQSSNGARRASDLMASPQFQNIIRQAVKEGVVNGSKASKALQAAEKSLAKSKKFGLWADTLGQPDQAALQAGLLTFLFKDQEEGK